MKGFFTGLLKLGVIGLAAFGAYELYKTYGKKEAEVQDFDDLQDAGFEYDRAAQGEESFAQKIKAAAERQLDKIK